MELTTIVGLTAASVTVLGALFAAGKWAVGSVRSISQRIDKLESALGSKQALVLRCDAVVFSVSTGRAIELPAGTPLTLEGLDDGETIRAKVFHDEVEVYLPASAVRLRDST